MTEYIERMIQNAQAAYRSMDDPLMDEAKFIADFLTAADVAPVQHGWWIRLDACKGTENFKCSFCRSESYVPTCMYEPMSAYCPNCGAKMDGGKEND